MPPHKIFLILFLSLFIARFVLERILAALNLRHVLARRHQIPETLKEMVSMEHYERSVDYTQAQTRFGQVEAVLSAALTLVFLFSGFIPWLNAQFQALNPGELTQGVALILAFTLISAFLFLPSEMYEIFIIESRFGFNQTTAGTFWLDKLKALLLALVIGIPFLYALLTLVTQTGPFWWLWAALFVIGFQLFLMILYPVAIAPLFNQFIPLEEGDLKGRLEELAAKCQFAAKGIFVMDGSKRSTHSNAYFTGIGRARRIVLFDTLIRQLSVTELVAVLAHEIGHYKRRHILKMLLISSGFTLLGFFILSLLIDWTPMYGAFGIAQPSVAVSILIFSLIAGAFTFWLEPLMNALSRKHEHEADAYAREQTADAHAMETALLKLFEENLATFTPHPAYSAYHYSHPTLLERITALRQKK